MPASALQYVRFQDPSPLLDLEMEAALRELSDDPILDLRYSKRLVDEQNVNHPDFTTSTQLTPAQLAGTPDGREAERFTAMLYDDFAYLHRRAETLSENLQNSMQSLTNNAASQESVKAGAHAGRV
ncbi:hypothetical protein BKA56DRAFT_619053 [Ilyonectria sp. MPI-CAGE-AT-0026]|nr:hypothetical protein BKA56DRAFT_619053 [Ilyonectria sp. MPI-CAGE-AT-0026]